MRAKTRRKEGTGSGGTPFNPFNSQPKNPIEHRQAISRFLTKLYTDPEFKQKMTLKAQIAAPSRKRPPVTLPKVKFLED